jgi:hypothetical protein
VYGDGDVVAKDFGTVDLSGLHSKSFHMPPRQEDLARVLQVRTFEL